MIKTQDLPLFKEFCILFKSFNINSWTKKDFIQYLAILGVEQHSYNHLQIIRVIIRLIVEDVLKIDDVPEREKNATYSESNEAKAFKQRFCLDTSIPLISDTDFERFISLELMNLLDSESLRYTHPHIYNKENIKREIQSLMDYQLKFLLFKNNL